MRDIRVFHDGSFTSQPGGGARVAREIAIALDAPITVGHAKNADWWLQDPGVDVNLAFQEELHGLRSKPIPQPGLEVRLGHLFRTLAVPEDVVITSGSAAKWIVPEAGQRHIHYCHVPPPRFYGEQQGRDHWLPKWMLNEQGALWDQHFASFVDDWIANSEWTKDRIHKHYKADSTVVNPPVRASSFEWLPPRTAPSRYFVAVPGRLVDMKRPVDIAEAFDDLPHDLAMVGDGPLRSECEQYGGVSVYPNLSNEALELLVGRSSGGLAMAKGEHCGLTPKEFQAAGKPAIVADEPNLCNHVVHEKTGMLTDPIPVAIKNSVERCAEKDWNRETIEREADGWSHERFHDEIRDIVFGDAEDIPTQMTEGQMVETDD